jgi:hypothetical protein
MENQRATIRAFASDAESILTCSLVDPAQTPSLQVSTLIADSTRSASFVTAWTSVSQEEAISNSAGYPRQLMFCGISCETTLLCGKRYGRQLMSAAEKIPLLMWGVRHHLTESAQTIRSMWDRPEEFTRFRRMLCLENLMFRNIFNLILSGSCGNRELQGVLTQPGGQAWTETQVEQELRRFLQHLYAPILEGEVDMHGALVPFTGRLGLCPDVGRVRSSLMIGCVLTVQVVPAQKSKVVHRILHYKRFGSAPRKSAYTHRVRDIVLI